MSAQHTPGPVTLELSDYEHSNACLVGVTEDARFHIWLDPMSLLPVDGVVYKNPPLGSDFRIRTIRLDMRRGGGKQVADAMLPQVHALYPAAKAIRDARVAQKLAAEEEAARVWMVKKAGLELLGALRELLAADAQLLNALAGPERNIAPELTAHAAAVNSANAAIAKATGAAS